MHMKNGDTQINKTDRHGKHKAILGPASWPHAKHTTGKISCALFGNMNHTDSIGSQCNDVLLT